MQPHGAGRSSPFPRSPFPVPLCLVLTLAGVSALSAQDPDFRWSAALAAGKTLEVVGVNGNIEARGGTGDALVTAVKDARRSDPDLVEIRVVEHDRGVTICAVYPSRRGRRPNTCEPGGGHNDIRDNDVEVHFTVTVPRGVELVARTVNGDIDATALDANADAHTVNGSVELETAGYGEATTVNGRIRARLGRADWDGELSFETVNGRIEVMLPASLDAEVTASTVNGSLDSDFPLTTRGRWGPKRMRGTVGEGGRGLHLSTVNADMELRRGA